jgi:hypothetical protein
MHIQKKDLYLGIKVKLESKLIGEKVHLDTKAFLTQRKQNNCYLKKPSNEILEVMLKVRGEARKVGIKVSSAIAVGN